MVIEEDYFDDMKLTDGAIFTTALIKRAKSRVNQKVNFPHDTNQCMRCSTKFCDKLFVEVDMFYHFRGLMLCNTKHLQSNQN